MLLLLGFTALLGLNTVWAQGTNQNQSPYFVKTLESVLVTSGIYENTTTGSVLGSISCVDPDGDSIAYFAAKTTSLSVGYVTGVVTLIKQLDREQSSNTVGTGASDEKPNTATFQCVDLDRNGFEKSERTFVDIDITVRDNNDELPVFVDTVEGYTFYIKESDPVGTVIDGTISITDDDRGVNAKLASLQIVCTADDPEPCNTFRVNYTQQNERLYTANIILTNNLDFERREDYRTQIRAVDGPGQLVQNTVSAGIRILVSDSQDTDPVFTNSEYTFELMEGLGKDSVVTIFGLSARDGDAGDAARRAVTLEVLPDPDGVNLFRAGPSTLANAASGVYRAPLIVQNEIDRENIQDGIYLFTAKVTELMKDGTRTDATATAVFTVNVLDLNDNSPVFSQSVYNVVMPEMGFRASAVQIPNLRIEVSDEDEPTNAQYILEIKSQNFSGAFGFTPNTQVSGTQIFGLTVNNFQFMDYDKPEYRSQTIVLQAVEILANSQRGTRSSSATVSVTLTDINDNYPVFAQSLYEGSLVENAANFSSILTVRATDADSGDNGRLTFSVENTVKNLFYINPTSGELRLIGSLDYEAVSEYTFLVSAVDKSDKPKTSQVLARVRVTDYNDVGPQFTLDSYTGRVTESSTTFESPVQVQAEDPSDPDAPITYKILSGNTPANSFVLDANTGVLTLRETLNVDQTFNRSGIFSLLVQASDNGVPEEVATTRITITVVDENNNDPVFNPTLYTKTISEAINPGTPLFQVSATDADFGSNGRITYRIGLGGRDNVVVSREGIVSISNFPSFDFDENQQLNVGIVAVDGGSPQRSSTATVILTITDANNKNPSFVNRLYTGTVNEVDPVGTSVLSVTATDPDSQNTLQYSIDIASIVAINRAGVQAGSIFPYDYRDAFAVDPVSGIITVNKNLNRDYLVESSFDVVVTDIHPTAIGTQTNRARVTITIQGQPDTELYFNPPWTSEQQVYTVPILESSPTNTDIMTLQARDPLDSNVLTNYEEIPGTDPGDYFRVVTKTNNVRGTTPGVVVLNRALDFESGDLIHSVVVQASRPRVGNVPPRTVTATISIQVQDFNDNEPVFSQGVYRFTVKENIAVNTQVGLITATDRDGPNFGPIEFTLGGGLDKDDFTLYQPPDVDGTALLLVNKPLDYERVRKYTIDVIATDNMLGRGSAIRLDSKAGIEVTVEDVNDNTPTFTDASRSFSVPEIAPLQTRLGQLIATDADTGANGDILYRMVPDTSLGSTDQVLNLFAITSRSGVLFTKSLLRGLSGGYRLLVIAEDQGTPKRSSSIPVTIKVQGSEDDDGTPKWLEPVNNVVVRVQEHNRTKLDLRFHAIARTENAKIIYRIARFGSYYDRFRVNSTTGDVYVIADLDYEVQPTYTVVVEAQDSLNSTKISRRTIIVQLIDIDDNFASFQKSRYDACPTDFEVPTVYTVQDNTPTGVIVGYAIACDPDGPINNNIIYDRYLGSKLCLDNSVGALVVNRNGSLETRRMLDYEDQTEYLVCVTVDTGNRRTKRAFDTNQMVNTDTIGYVIIRVIDANDNGPSFPKDQVTAVLETLPTERAIIQVTATDPDGPLNNKVRYSIADTMYYPSTGKRPYPLKGAFSINPNTGIISTNLPSYEDFARGYFEISVTAFDVMNQLFNDTTTVKVIVHQRSQVLRVVLNKPPAEGIRLSSDLIKELNQAGGNNIQFFVRSTTEHRTASISDDTKTDICLVVVENNLIGDTVQGITLLDMKEYRDVLTSDDYRMVDRGVCYPMKSSQQNVKWRDLWWVLVVIAIFIFVCIFILIVTICILYDRYKTYMDTQQTYLVAQ